MKLGTEAVGRLVTCSKHFPKPQFLALPCRMNDTRPCRSRALGYVTVGQVTVGYVTVGYATVGYHSSCISSPNDFQKNRRVTRTRSRSRTPTPSQMYGRVRQLCQSMSIEAPDVRKYLLPVIWGKLCIPLTCIAPQGRLAALPINGIRLMD